MNLLIYALLSGVLFGLFYALVGVGLNLVFGVMRVVNLAHGDIVMIGAYSAFWLYTLWHISPLLAIPIIFVSLFIVGCVAYYGLIPRILSSEEPELISLVLFFGVSQILESGASILFGNNQRSLPVDSLGGGGAVKIAGQTIPWSWIWSAVVALIALALMFFYLYRTRLGYATRALMSDRNEAASVGINVSGVSAINFGIGIALAGVPGCFLSFISGNIAPDIGLNITIIAFAVIVVGSLGKPMGAIIGGLLYGIGVSLMQVYLPSWANLLPNALLIAIMLVKPNGLLGGYEVRRA